MFRFCKSIIVKKLCVKGLFRNFIACLAVPFGLKPRITDGENAKPGEFPYQISIRWGIPPFIPFTHACGGSILNERHVLTAGHCIMKFGKLKVFAGKHYLFKDENTQQEVDVSKAYVHANYSGYVYYFYLHPKINIWKLEM